MILGSLEADEGDIELQPNTVVAHVAQETPSVASSAMDFVIDGDRHLRQVQADIEQAEASGGADKDPSNYARLLEQFEQCGGYTAESRAGILLNGLGFRADEHKARVNEFSGGWRMRLNLAQALMCPSDLLLLDEPTNHLDIDAVFWLESWLRKYDGSLLLISHDREFLDSIVGSILHIENQEATSYTGNYTAFEKYRVEVLARQQAMYTRQQKKIKEIERFVDRFRAKATKAKQAQSRVKMLERMSRVAPAHVDAGVAFSFKEPEKESDPLVTLEKASLGYEGTRVLSGVTVQLRMGDRIALLGINGAGKSTLVKSLVGELPLIEGQRTAGTHLIPGYFAQHQLDQLDYRGCVLDQLLLIDPKLSEAKARNYLGQYGFSGDSVMQEVTTLSGGEKARLVLAIIIYQRPNLLLLDEPTNHLDMDMRMALSIALQSFTGALVVVSHDRFLLESVADELWLVADGGVSPHNDDLAGYRKWLINKRRDNQAAAALANVEETEEKAIPADTETTAANSPRLEGQARKEQKKQDAERRKQLAPLRKQVEKTEVRYEKLQAEMESLQQKLTNNELYTGDSQSELTGLLKTRKALERGIQEAEDDWMKACQLLEQAEEQQASG